MPHTGHHLTLPQPQNLKRDQEHSKSGRASKYQQWFKSYGHFAEGVDLPVGGVALGRVCACSLRSRLVFEIGQGLFRVFGLFLLGKSLGNTGNLSFRFGHIQYTPRTSWQTKEYFSKTSKRTTGFGNLKSETLNFSFRKILPVYIRSMKEFKLVIVKLEKVALARLQLPALNIYYLNYFGERTLMTRNEQCRCLENNPG